mgnify:CR=1 FL=1
MTRPCSIVVGPHTQPVREREGRAHWHAMPTTYRKLHRLALCGLPVLEVGVGLAERGDEARDLELVRVRVDACGLQGVHAAHAVLVVGRGVGLLLLNLLALVLLLAGALHLLRLALWHKHGATRGKQPPAHTAAPGTQQRTAAALALAMAFRRRFFSFLDRPSSLGSGSPNSSSAGASAMVATCTQHGITQTPRVRVGPTH